MVVSSTMFLVIFCMLDLSVTDRGVLKSPHSIEIVHFSLQSCFCVIYLDSFLFRLIPVTDYYVFAGSDPFIIV